MSGSLPRHRLRARSGPMCDRVRLSKKRRQKSLSVVGSGVALGAQRVEVDLVIAPQFEIFQAGAAHKMLYATLSTWSDSW